MECKEVKRKMPAFICGDLLQHEEKILRNHIQTCHECKQIFNEFNMLKDTIKMIKLNGEEDFINKTMSRIDELQQKRFTYRFKNVFKNVFKKRKWIAYAITVLLILIIFGYVLGFFDIFTKPQELSAQEILLKSVTSPEEVKSYHMKVTSISYPYPPYDFRYKQEEKNESWFEAPDKFRGIRIISYPDNPYAKEEVYESIILGNKCWELQPDGTWILYKMSDTSDWFDYVKGGIEEIREDTLKFREESETNLIKEDEIAGREVYVIEYIYREGNKIDRSSILYIDKETFLILASKSYDNNKQLMSETTCDLIEYNIEINDSLFKQPPDDVVIDAKSFGLTDFEEGPMDSEETNNIYEAEKKAGYKIPIPEYIPEGYKLGRIKFYPEREGVDIYNRDGEFLRTEDRKNPYREVSIDYFLNKKEGNITYFGQITIFFNKLVGLTDDKLVELTDNELYSVFMPLIEGQRREEIQIDEEIKFYYKPEYKSESYINQADQNLEFACNNIWIQIIASSDISKDELIKIANSMLD